MQSSPESAVQATAPATRRGRWKLLAVLLVCAAPVIASYLAYYVIRPEGRTNYGELLSPMTGIGDLVVREADGDAGDLAVLRGKWVLVAIDPGPCAKDCEERLYAIRQVRLTTGKERERVERLMLLTGEAAPSPALLAQHDGMHVRRAAPDAVARAFPAEVDAAAHVYVVDPLGNVMMRFPAPADPNRMKKDLSKLLRASRIG